MGWGVRAVVGSRKKVQPAWPGESLEGPCLSAQGERDIIECCLAREGEMSEVLREETVEVANEILESMVLRDDDARVLWANVPTHAEMHETLRSVAYYSKELLGAIARLDMTTAGAIADHGFTGRAWEMVEDAFRLDRGDGGVVAPQKKRDVKALMLVVSLLRELNVAATAAHEEERFAAERGGPRDRREAASAFVVGACASLFTHVQVQLREQKPELAYKEGRDLETEARLAFTTRIVEEGGVLDDVPGNHRHWIEEKLEAWCKDPAEVTQRAKVDGAWFRRLLPLVGVIRGLRRILDKEDEP